MSKSKELKTNELVCPKNIQFKMLIEFLYLVSVFVLILLLLILIFGSYFVGIHLAKGVLGTLAAIFFPPYAWFLTTIWMVFT